jgi:hypothetical protein
MTRFRTRWVVVAFVVIGVLIALWLIVRDLGDSSDAPEQDGTLASAAAR